MWLALGAHDTGDGSLFHVDAAEDAPEPSVVREVPLRVSAPVGLVACGPNDDRSYPIARELPWNALRIHVAGEESREASVLLRVSPLPARFCASEIRAGSSGTRAKARVTS